MSFSRPSQRDDFEIAIVCALKAEFDAVCLVVEEFWDGNQDIYGKANGDINCYRTGRIGKHNIILLQLRQMGKAHAAAAAAGLRSSFTRLRLAFLVGGCAAVPQSENANIVLGDIIISTGIVQYDFGRKFPDKFIRKNTGRDNLVKPCKEVGNILTTLQTPDITNKLTERLATLLIDLQKNAHNKGYGSRYGYPGVHEDKLYKSSYHHKHRDMGCPTCIMADDSTCDEARITNCEDLGCGVAGLVAGRQRLEEKLQSCRNDDMAYQNPDIFFGLVGSGDSVMKSGCDRDRLAEEEGVIAFEMEAAGFWEDVPTLVVKGVFDYGDSHKNKLWHHFSSATAACAARAIIERLAQTDQRSTSIYKEVPSDHRIENNHAISSWQENLINNATTNTRIIGSISENMSLGGSKQSNIINFSNSNRTLERRIVHAQLQFLELITLICITILIWALKQ
ncbi:uncharacterized protein TrAtP1_004474 [Trichoderma atroviride]|uniref:uncharacterized protein n=1 Tax=Hypocrea atroviridis TaxID=63577 RepID=UPI003324F01E|nr:hypothetical protein TrAtP1_004474 [Trichoderma atroviride]